MTHSSRGTGSSRPFIIEACVQSVTEAREAQRRGADRIELCAALDVDGLTPDLKTVEECLSFLSIPIKVLLRPRAGDFTYSPDIKRKMLFDLDALKSLGVDEIVTGAIDRGGLDMVYLKEILLKAHPMQVSIHKAIDACLDPAKEIQRLIRAGGFHSVLTSGKARTAIEGAAVIREMIHHAGDQLEIVAAGKISDQNLYDIHTILQCRAYHGRKILGDLSF